MGIFKFTRARQTDCKKIDTCDLSRYVIHVHKFECYYIPNFFRQYVFLKIAVLPKFHRTEIIDSGLCAETPHHFPSRLFYLHFDGSPTN